MPRTRISHRRASYFVSFKYLFPLLLFFAAACNPEAPSSNPEKETPTIPISPSPSHPLSPSPNQLPEQPPILLLGSTFSVARGLSPDLGYAAMLQQRLTESRAPFAILNASVAGETAAGASERLRYLLDHPLEQVILELGQADEQRKTPPGAFARDVRKLLQHIQTQQPEAPILILASCRKGSYFEALASAAEAHGVRLSTLLTETRLPVRPDDAALHRRLAEALWPLIRKGS